MGVGKTVYKGEVENWRCRLVNVRKRRHFFPESGTVSEENSDTALAVSKLTQIETGQL